MSRIKQNGATQVYHRQGQNNVGSEGEATILWASFVTFRETIAILTPFGSHFAHFKSHSKQLNCSNTGYMKELSCPAPIALLSYLQLKFKTHLNACICELNFLNDTTQMGAEGPFSPSFRDSTTVCGHKIL